MKNMEISYEELRKHKLFVATPMYSGICSGYYTKSMTDLASVCTKHGITMRLYYLFNESLVQRARNYCVDQFLRSDCTHFMFIDSDIGFQAYDVLGLLGLSVLEDKYDVVCGPYPKKTLTWEKIKQAVDAGVADEDPSELENYVGDYVFSVINNNEISMTTPFEVKEAGTGFMMIRREVFEDYAEKFPQLEYKPDHARSTSFDGSKSIHAFFDCEIDPDSKRYLSEDYFFCRNVRSIGKKVWICPWMRLQHIGTQVYGGSLPHLAGIGAAMTVDPSRIKKK